MSIANHNAPFLARRQNRLGLRSYVAIFGTLLLAAFLTFASGGAQPAFAVVSPPTIDQCNYDETGAAREIRCSVTVVNTYDAATTVGSSVVSTSICTGAPGAAIVFPGVCIVTTNVPYSGVITSVNQCNNSVNAGGSWVQCDVTITNIITGTGTPTAATVNQCNGSNTGGTIVSFVCDPTPATTISATITQCNGSANGGGSEVTCSVPYAGPSAATQTAALLVTVTQCNDSANGNGDTVRCNATQSNTITPAGGPSGPALPPTGFDGWSTAIFGTFAVMLGALLFARSRSLKKKATNN